MSIRYSERLAKADIEPSVGSRGDSYDNALAGTINCLYLLPVLTFDESGHVDSRDRDTSLYLHHRCGVKEFHTVAVGSGRS